MPLPLKLTVLVAAVVRPPARPTEVVPGELQVNRPFTVRSPVPPRVVESDRSPLLVEVVARLSRGAAVDDQGVFIDETVDALNTTR